MIEKSSKIYVAGHNGMVGSAIVATLEQAGYDRIVTAERGELDLRNQQEVLGYIDAVQPDVVIVAAARVGGIKANNDFPYQFLYDNLMIESNLIDAAHRKQVHNLIYLGSSCVYPKRAPQPLKEEYLLTGPLEPTNQWYAIAKISGIKLCQALNRQYGRNYISLMPTNLYGPRDNFDLETSHVLPAMIRKFHDAKEDNHSPVTLWGSGTPKREFLHVSDLADAIQFLLEADPAALTDETGRELGAQTGGSSHAGGSTNTGDSSQTGPGNHFYTESGLPDLINIGTGEDLSIRELATLIRSVTGHEGDVHWDESKPDGTPRKLMDVSLMKSLGWEASVSLEPGLKTTYEWFLENRDSVREITIETGFKE